MREGVLGTWRPEEGLDLWFPAGRRSTVRRSWTEPLGSSCRLAVVTPTGTSIPAAAGTLSYPVPDTDS